MNQAGFAGLKVAAFESRMAEEMTRLIRRYGGEPLVTPALREVPLEDSHPIFDFGARLLADEFDMVIFLTGVGVRYLMEVLQSCYPLESIKRSLSRVTMVVRGPKPVAVLKEFGLSPAITVPEPNTWKDLLRVLDETTPSLRGRRIAVQEYGTSNPELLGGLSQRGAEVLQVPVYRWGLPENVAPLQRTLDQILKGQVHVILITNAAQVDNIVTVLDREEKTASLRGVVKQTIVASIGPTASERLRHYRLPVDLEPSHPKMGHLVKEASEVAHGLLHTKRGN